MIKYIFNKEIIGYDMGKSNNTYLVQQATNNYKYLLIEIKFFVQIRIVIMAI